MKPTWTLLKKPLGVINGITPIKEICIKNNTTEWVDEESLEGIRIRDKLFRKFKKLKSNVDNINYKEASYNNCLGEKDKVPFDNKENAETFKNFYENLASDLVEKLPLPTDKFGKEKIKDFYKHLNIENNNFTLKPTTYKNVLSLNGKTKSK